MCRPRTWTSTAPFGMVASILESDTFLGRVLTGRVEQGRATLNMPVKVYRLDGTVVETGRLTKLLSFRGLDRVAVDEVARRRHRRRRRPDRCHRAGDHRLAGTARPAARHPDRPADPLHDLPHQ